VASRDEQRAEAIAHWLGEQKGEPVRFEKVEPGDEQIPPERDQRELDALPSVLDRGERARPS
jgi:hypothetical protein